MPDIVAKMKLRNKILCIVAAICLFTLASMSLVSYFAIRKISEHSVRTNIVFGDEAADSAGSALTTKAHSFLLIIAAQQARNCNALLNSIKYDVELLAGVTTDLFNDQKQDPLARSIAKPPETVKSKYAGMYILPKTVPMTEKIRQELNLLSNLGLLLPTLIKHPDIKEFYAGMESGLFYSYTQLPYSDPEYDPRIRPWYLLASEQPGKVIFTEVYEDPLGLGLVMTAAKAVFDTEGRRLGVVALDLLLDSMKALVLETRIMKSGYAFIINSEGKYIIHPGMDKEGFQAAIPEAPQGSESSAVEGYKKMMNGETGFVLIEENGKEFFMAFSPISVTGWSVGVTVSKDELLSTLEILSTQMILLADKAKKEIEEISEETLVMFFTIFLVVTIMVVILSVILTSVISKPVQRLAEEVAGIGAGHLDAKIVGKYDDELDKIKNAVNAMAADTKAYMEGMLHAEKELAASKISLMLSQIKPHFLYNSLAIIQRLCAKDPKLAEETVVEFTEYLRGNMDSLAVESLIPFAKELHHLESYLALEKKRFGARLNVVYEIFTENFSLPVLTVQPIVENAVRHGVTKREEGGTVTIRTEESEKDIVITVRDDGAGFDPDAKKHGGRQGIGMENVSKRLAAMCGGALTVTSAAGIGTTVIMTIPKGEAP